MASLMTTNCGICNNVVGSIVHTCCLRCRNFSAADKAARDYALNEYDGMLEEQIKDLEAAGSPLSSPEILRQAALLITDGLTDKLDQARAIFIWISLNITFEPGSELLHPIVVFKTRRCVCRGFSLLFALLMQSLEIPCDFINGRSKVPQLVDAAAGGSAPSAELRLEESNHAWNVFQPEEGTFKLVDSTWGSNGEIGTPTTNVVNVCYFTMSNDEFFLQHFPTETEQVLKVDPRNIPGASQPKYSYLSPTATGVNFSANFPQWKSIPVPPTIINSHRLDIVNLGKLQPQTRVIKLTETEAFLYSQDGPPTLRGTKTEVLGIAAGKIKANGSQAVAVATFEVSLACSHLRTPVNFYLNTKGDYGKPGAVPVQLQPNCPVQVDVRSLMTYAANIGGVAKKCLYLEARLGQERVNVVEWELPAGF